MEKFGIFELLDTLSAFASHESGETPQKNGQASDGNAKENAPQAPPPPEAASERDRAALDDFLARHNRISKKIDEKK